MSVAASDGWLSEWMSGLQLLGQAVCWWVAGASTIIKVMECSSGPCSICWRKGLRGSHDACMAGSAVDVCAEGGSMW